MLYKSQRTTANFIGAALGVLIVVVLLVTNAPSSASPSLGANVKMSAYAGTSIEPSPLRPKNFIDVTDLKPGAPPVTGELSLTSDNTKPVMVTLALDELTKNAVPDIPFAPALTFNFGKGGALGSTTLTTMATTPIPAFEMQPGETVKIPVEVSLPLTAVRQAGGQEASIALVPEVVP